MHTPSQHTPHCVVHILVVFIIVQPTIPEIPLGALRPGVHHTYRKLWYSGVDRLLFGTTMTNTIGKTALV